MVKAAAKPVPDIADFNLAVLGERSILVVNRHHYQNKPFPEGYQYLGRPHPLSNPFTVEDYGREGALDLFRRHLKAILRDRQGEAWNCLVNLASDYAAGIPIALGCSCAPQPCHLDLVKETVVWLAGKLFPALAPGPTPQPAPAPAAPKIALKASPKPNPAPSPEAEPLRVGERVRHVNPKVVSRAEIGGKMYRRGEEGDRPRRAGVVMAVNEPGSLALGPGVVSVLWDDAATATIHTLRQFKDGHYGLAAIKGGWDNLPISVLEREVAGGGNG